MLQFAGLLQTCVVCFSTVADDFKSSCVFSVCKTFPLDISPLGVKARSDHRLHQIPPHLKSNSNCSLPNSSFCCIAGHCFVTQSLNSLNMFRMFQISSIPLSRKVLDNPQIQTLSIQLYIFNVAGERQCQ